MKKFVQNLAALVKVKTIVTLVVLVVFAVLALRGDITPENVMQITTMIIAFYFGTQHEQKFSENTDHSNHCPFITESTEESAEDGGDLNV